jgi:hypothetical protein
MLILDRQIDELRSILGSNLAESLDGQTDSDLMSLPLNVLTYVIIGVVAACSVILVILAYYLRREFGYVILSKFNQANLQRMQRYRFLGADLQIRKYYFHFQVFECTCYFSAFFCAGFGIQFIWLSTPSMVHSLIADVLCSPPEDRCGIHNHLGSISLIDSPPRCRSLRS